MSLKNMMIKIPVKLAILVIFSFAPVLGMDNHGAFDNDVAQGVAEVRQAILDFSDQQIQNPNLQNFQAGDVRQAVQQPVQQIAQQLQQRGVNINPAVQGVQQFIGQEAQHYGIQDDTNLAELVGRVRNFAQNIDMHALDAELQALDDNDQDINLNVFRDGQLAGFVQWCHDYLARQGQNPLLQRNTGELVDGAGDFWNQQIVANPQLLRASVATLAREVGNALNQVAQNPAIQNLGVGANLAQAQAVVNLVAQHQMAQFPVPLAAAGIQGVVDQIPSLKGVQGAMQHPIAQQAIGALKNMNVADVPRLAADGIEMGQNIFEAVRDSQNRVDELEQLFEDEERLIEEWGDQEKDNENHLFKDTVIGEYLGKNLEIPVGSFPYMPLERHWDGVHHEVVWDRSIYADVALNLNGYDALKVTFFLLQTYIEKKLYAQFTEYCQDCLLSNFEQKKDAVVTAYNAIVQANGAIDEESLPLLKTAFAEQFVVKADIGRKPMRMLLFFLISEMLREYCETLIIPPQDLSSAGLDLFKCFIQEDKYQQRRRDAGFWDAPAVNPAGDRHFQVNIHPVHMLVNWLRSSYFGEHKMAGFMKTVRPFALELVQGRYPEDHWYHQFLKYMRKAVGDLPVFDDDESAFAHIQDEQERDRERMRRSSWDTKFVVENGEKIFAWQRCFKTMVARYQDCLKAHIDKNHDEFLLKVSRVATAYTLEELMAAEEDLKDFIKRIEQEPFKWWVYYKNQSYGRAIALIEGILLIPGFVEVGKMAGSFCYKAFQALRQDLQEDF